MLIIVKDGPNFIIRHQTDEPNHTFKINVDGTIFGYKGRPVKRLPKGFKKLDFVCGNMQGIDNAHKDILSHIVNGENITLISFFERMYNAGVKNLTPQYYGHYIHTINSKTFKQWLKLAREYETEYPEKSYTLQTLQDYEKEKEFLSAKQVQDIITYYGEYTAKQIYSQYKNQWNKVVKWLCDDTFYKAFVVFNGNRNYKVINIIRDMVAWSALLNIKLENKDPLGQYLKLQRQYELYKERIPNETLQKNQNKEWSIETNELIAIVPTTMEELIQEGKNNHNCVGDYWTYSYGNNLKRGVQNRGLVFIRKKSQPEKSYITCDFSLRTFEILQFLGNCNQRISDKEALKFKKMLQNHLETFR